MELTDDIIADIAGDLELGLSCYFDKTSGELFSIPNPRQWYKGDLIATVGDTEWDSNYRRVRSDPDNYIELAPMDSHDSILVMAGFAKQLNNSKLEERLLVGMSNGKPFMDFKHLIDNNDTIREQWFSYKFGRNVAHVKKQIELANQA